jgi:hypothetical protein
MFLKHVPTIYIAGIFVVGVFLWTVGATCHCDKENSDMRALWAQRAAGLWIGCSETLCSDPPVGTGLPDPDRQMRRQTSVPTLADPSAHPCRSWSRLV